MFSCLILQGRGNGRQHEDTRHRSRPLGASNKGPTRRPQTRPGTRSGRGTSLSPRGRQEGKPSGSAWKLLVGTGRCTPPSVPPNRPLSGNRGDAAPGAGASGKPARPSTSPALSGSSVPTRPPRRPSRQPQEQARPAGPGCLAGPSDGERSSPPGTASPAARTTHGLRTRPQAGGAVQAPVTPGKAQKSQTDPARGFQAPSPAPRVTQVNKLRPTEKGPAPSGRTRMFSQKLPDDPGPPRRAGETAQGVTGLVVCAA